MVINQLKYIIHIITFLTVCICTLQSGYSQVRTVNLYVNDNHGNPVNNANVTLSAQYIGIDLQEQAIFREEGRYTIQIPVQLIDKEFDIDVTAHGIVPFRRTVYWAGEQRLSVTVTAVALRNFVVQALDQRGQRIEGAQISLVPVSGEYQNTITTQEVGIGRYRAQIPASLIGSRLNVRGDVDGYESVNTVISWNGESTFSLTFREEVLQKLLGETLMAMNQSIRLFPGMENQLFL